MRITDVAALAGVSIGTASKALNDTGQLRQETRERVRAAAAKLGFVVDARGRALSSGRSYTVGMITTDSFGRFSIPVMLGAEDVLSAGQMAVLMCDTRDDIVRENHYVRSLSSRRVDGVIVTGRSAEARPPIRVDMPVVYAFTPSTSPDDVSITLDDAAGAALLADHLVAIGRRRVAYVTGPQHHSAAHRRAESAQARLGDRLVGQPLYGEWSERWGRQAVDLLVHGGADLDAIACGSDQIARGVCDRLRELGRSVPHDVAVTGFDDWDVMALASRPPLTTVNLRLEELGRQAGRALLALIDGDTPERRLAVQPTLVIRESTVGG
ncbi:LacI family transcriptional regulator [Curtobacterium sp. MCBD17_034]|nr:LacI family transcriptional regulator [Curtobacterium sp. MCBD17_028]PZE73406.1 LacI family transcriptional regulator [Curtobacterium sp. MCBD17_019]PZF55513.1 LacI family transcriptional regulator [Curtobacterium sp. MCBD17_034]PZF58142.1 LacI family transcriptional regulator [Curtobacterium sp. MCBD17_013]PZM35094.1 LacI family transcriptional regulator [Curtobacterium sp. MCBD17_031]